MERIETTSTAFSYLVKELEKEFVGGYINNIQEVELNFKESSIDEKIKALKIKIHKKQTKELIVSEKTLFMSRHKIPVLEKTRGLSVYLRKKVYNQRIQEIKQDKNNRVIYFKLDHYYLIFEFFSNSNIILTDLDFITQTSKKQEFWKDREIKTKTKYNFPQVREISEILEDQEIDKIEDKKKKIRYIVKEYNVDPWYLEEIYSSKDTIKAQDVYDLYSFVNPELIVIKDKNKNLIVCKEGETKEITNNLEKEKQIEETENLFFKKIEDIYLYKEIEKPIKTESKKMSRVKRILEDQERIKIEYKDLINYYEKKGVMIYEHFTLIEEINRQIKFAREKKIEVKEIEEKINNHLSKTNPDLQIKDIDLKERTYKFVKKK